ncbi:MAG: ABC transporter permease [Blastocatellia bacterium AA13]|nr:MAG: ABC transporter permease [Blastocatellia bacterium AA13]
MAIPLKYNLRNLFVRRVTTLMTVFTVALVVAVFIAIMSLANGLSSALVSTGSPENVIAIRESSQSEVQSSVTREAFQIIQTLPGVARDPQGKPLASAEIAVLVNLPRRGSGEPSNVTIRGVSEAGFALRPLVKIVAGQMLRPGLGEAIVSRKIADRFESTEIGETIHLGRRDWKVVGLFDAGGTAFDSEIWSNVNDVADAFDRLNYSSVLVRAENVAARDQLASRITGEQRLKLESKPEVTYYEEQTSVGGPIKALGIFVGVILGIGACFGGMNTMYAAVAYRTREIGTLRALGFSKASILTSFVIESVIIALIGGVVGCILSIPFNGIATGTTNFRTFSEVAFSFRITPDLVISALIFAAIMGVFGGLLPSRLAARMPITKTLREM